MSIAQASVITKSRNANIVRGVYVLGLAGYCRNSRGGSSLGRKNSNGVIQFEGKMMKE